MFEYIFSFLAPHPCLACGKEGSLLCTRCTNDLLAPPDVCYRCGKTTRPLCSQCAAQVPFHRLISRTGYQSTAKDLVHRLKFVRAAEAARVIAASMAVSLAEYRGSAAVIAYVPTASGRVRMRGYDQSHLIAKHLSRILHLPCRSLLLRVGQTRQVGADRRERTIQSQHAFVIRPKVTIPETEIILIDDVITTGATLEAAATALSEAGCGKITAATFASATKCLVKER